MSYRRYLVCFATLTAVLSLALAALNVSMDPYGALRHALPLPTQGKILSSTRTAKAEALRHERCDVILLGTSRVRTGIPTTSDLWGERRVCDAALDGTNLYEIEKVFRLALRHQQPTRILLGVDLLLFGDYRSENADFAVSHFNSEASWVEYYAEKLLGRRATEASLKLLKKNLKRRTVHDDERKKKKRRKGKRGKSNLKGTREAVRQTLQQKFFVDEDTYNAFHYSQNRLQLLGEMVKTAREQKIRLDLIINPVHAFQLEAMDRMGIYEHFEQMKLDAARLAGKQGESTGVYLWDFTGYEGYVAESVPHGSKKMRWYSESSHYKENLGKLVVQRITSSNAGDSSSFGRRLFADTAAEQNALVRIQRKKWRSENPSETRWLDMLYEQTAKERERRARSARPGDFTP